MKLKSVEIRNFRNVEHDLITLDNKSVIISGENRLGKTNRLMAIVWAITGTLLDGTAKENKMNLLPLDANMDTATSVILTFEDGLSIERNYRKEWKQGDDGEYFPLSAKTTFSINGGKPLSSVRDGENKIYEQLGISDLVDKFKKDASLKTVNLLSLVSTITNITTLDNNTLRALIMDIVGDINVLEIAKRDTKYEFLINELKSEELSTLKDNTRYSLYGDKNTIGLYDKVKIDRQSLEDIKTEISKEFDVSEVEEAKKKVAEIDTKIEDNKVSLKSSVESLTDKIDLQISNTKNELRLLEEKIKLEHEKTIENSEYNSLKKQIESKETIIQGYKDTLKNLNYELFDAKNKLNSNNEVVLTASNNIQLYKDKLNELNEKFKNIVPTLKDEDLTCPCCNETFKLSATPQHKEIFDNHIKAIKDDLLKQANEYKLNLEEATSKHEKFDKISISLLKEVEEKKKSVVNLETKITESENELVELNKKSILARQELPILSLETKDTQILKDKIKTLENERNSVLSNIDDLKKKKEEEITQLQEERKHYDSIIDVERSKNSNKNLLTNLELKLEETQKTLLNTEKKYEMLKLLEKDCYKELENKVEVKFGKDIYFKLYEPNIDGTYKTNICEMYLRDSNNNLVPITNGINQGEYIIKMVNFLDKIRNHYHIPNGTLFIDGLEVLDDTTIKRLGSENQIIATQVSNSPKIEFKLF